MRIPTNPGGPSSMPSDAPQDKGTAPRNTGTAGTRFAAQRPIDQPATPTSPGRLAAASGWQRASLNESSSLDAMLRASISQLVSSSSVAARLTDAQRANLELHLATDPVLRDLLTQHLEQNLA